MFIESRKTFLDFSLQRSDMNDSSFSFHYIALRWSAKTSWREGYKHLAPLEQEQCLDWSTGALSVSLKSMCPISTVPGL